MDVPDRAEFAKEIEELLWRDVEATKRLAHLRAAWRTNTNLKFLTKRALCENDMSAEVVCVGRGQPCRRARNAERRNVPVDFRCYILPTATHTLATGMGDREGLLVAQSEEDGRAE